MKIKASAIARTAALLIALFNTVLCGMDKNPLPFSDTEVYNWVSNAAVIITALAAWWKNNSFTKNARAADEYLEYLKNFIKE